MIQKINNDFENVLNSKNDDANTIKQEKLIEFILSISNQIIPNDDLKNKTEHILEIYDTTFRHSYSNISKVLIQIIKDTEIEQLSIIVTNLSKIIEFAPQKTKENKEKIKKVFKLKDHVELEIIRHKYIKEKYEKEINEIKNKAEKLETNLKDKAEKLENDIGQSKKDLENSKINYVTILGIFSAFVISFTSGIGFSNQILSNVGKVDFPILLMIVSIIAIFIGNIIFALFRFILYLNNKVEPFSKKEPLKNFTFGFTAIFIIIFCISICLYNSSKKIANDKIIENNQTNVIDLNNTKTK